MAENNRFVVPKEQQADFNLLIQRANRQIKSNLKYIQQEDIRSESAKRALLGDYVDQGSWHTEKTPFSRSKVFSSAKAYAQYVRHVQKWGGDYGKIKTDERHTPEEIKAGYYKSIVKALTTVAIDNGAGGILTKQGRLPAQITKALRGLSLEQISNFFEHADPSEEIEYYGFSSYDYLGVDKDEFIDITMGKINKLKQLFPANSNTSKPKNKVKSVKRKKRKSNRRKKRK